MLRVTHNMNPYEVSRFQPSSPASSSPSMGLKDLRTSGKQTSIALVQLILPDCNILYFKELIISR
jgi:hypothetical protein